MAMHHLAAFVLVFAALGRWMAMGDEPAKNAAPARK
jgi:hypothetical protein